MSDARFRRVQAFLPLKAPTWLAGAGVAALAAGAALGQDAPPPLILEGPVGGWIAGIDVTGRIEAGASFNPASPVSGINFGQLFTDKANQFVLNQIDLDARRTPASDRLDFGFEIEGSYGLDSQFTHFFGIGDQGSTGRNSWDFTQFNLQAHAPLPWGLGLDVKGGGYVTPMGYERLDPTENFFYSNSYIFNFGLPRKHFGVLTTTHVGSAADVILGYDTGANTSIGPGGGYDDGQPHLLAGAAVRLPNVTLQAFTHVGPEDRPAVLPPGVNPHSQLRWYDDASVAWKASSRLTLATEFNYVRDEGLKADAGGVAQYVTYALSPAVSLGLRAEVWRDATGDFVAGYPGNLDYLDAEEGLTNHAFHAGPATYGEVTLGLNLKPAFILAWESRLAGSPLAGATIRPEVRYDRVLAGEGDFGGRPGSARDQVTLAVDLVIPLSFQHAAPVRDFDAATAAEATEGPIATARSAAGLAPVSGPAFAVSDPQQLQDLNGRVPNLTLATTASDAALAYIRGLGDPAPHSGQTPGVGLAVDGVAVDGVFAQLLDPFDLADMQVTRGPAGLADGADAPFGRIDFTRQAPSRAWGLVADYSLEQGFHGGDERLRLDAPLGDTAGVSLSLSHRQRGGYDTDVYSGQVLYGRDETTLGDLKVSWSVTPALEADLDVTLAHGDGQGEPYALGDSLDAARFGPGPLGPYQTAADGPNGQSVTAQFSSLRLAWDTGAGKVTSITGFLHEDVATAQDLDGGCAGEDACDVLENPLVGVLNLTTRQTYRQFSEEVRFDRDLGPMAQVHAGALFLDGRTDWRTDESAAEDLRSWAAYGEVDIHPVSRLTLTGALRFVDDRQSWSGDAQGSGEWRHLLSRLAADWRLTDALSLFADRTTGFRPGGLALGEALPAASSGVFGSESDVDWEGGIRLNRLGGALSGELVGFYTRVSGLQAPQTVLTPGLPLGFATPIANLPLVESKGVDLQLAWRVGAVPGLTLSGVGGFDDVSDDPAGEPLPRAPRFDGTARLDYAREVGPGVWAFEAAYRWTDRYALADLGNQGDWQSAYGLLDFSVAYSRGAYRIAVTARNLLNKVYLDTAQPAFFVHGWGEPRTTVVSVQAKF